MSDFKVGGVYLIEEDNDHCSIWFNKIDGYCVGDHIRLVRIDDYGTAVFCNLTRPERANQISSSLAGLRLLDEPEESKYSFSEIDVASGHGFKVENGWIRIFCLPEEDGEELSPEEEATDWMNSQMYDRDCRLPSTREQAFADKQEYEQLLKQSEAVVEANRIQKRNSAVITAMGFNNQPVSKNGK